MMYMDSYDQKRRTVWSDFVMTRLHFPSRDQDAMKVIHCQALYMRQKEEREELA